MPSDTVAAHLDRLRSISTELGQLQKELAQVLIAERQAKLQAWMANEQSSVQARDRYADFNAVGYTVDVFRLRADILALEAERDYIHFAVKYGQ